MLFVTLAVMEFFVYRLVPPVIRVPLILPLLIVFATELPAKARTSFRTLMLLAILGGLAGELGSALRPGLVLVTYTIATILVSLIAQRLVSTHSMGLLTGLLFFGVTVVRLGLVLAQAPQLLDPQPPMLLLRTLMLLVVIPGVIGVPVGLLWHLLLRREGANGISRLLLPKDSHA
jgi:hypothetical protein